MKRVSLLLLLTLSFAQGESRWFPADAVVDVTQPPYGAIPDDGQDDTAALQRCISDNVGTGRVLYLSAGVYDISDTLVAKNNEGVWRAHLTLQGENRERTIIRLTDASPGFGEPEAPKALLMTGSHWEKGDSLDGGGNKAFRNNLFNLTLDTGSGNPGAMGVAWAVSNIGAIKGVTIVSGDGAGVAGISMRRKIPGPGLIKDVSVQGFDYGLDVGDLQYGVTVENLDLSGQRKAGIRVSKNLIHARKVTSDNTVPALLVTHREGMVTLLDSTLQGRAEAFCAIMSEGVLFLRAVYIKGYGERPLYYRGREIPDGWKSGWASPPDKTYTAPADLSALLPVRETPDYWNNDLEAWQAVGERLPGETDDTAAIQRAIDAGKPVVYFRNDRVYFLSDTMVVRGAVEHILGMGAEINLGAAKEPFSDREHPRPLFRIDPTEGAQVTFENVFFNAQYPGEVIFENNSPKPLVIKHCAGWVGTDGQRRSYRNTENATGPVFIEDVFLPGWDFDGQSVWARQFNPENFDGDGSEAQVVNRGGRLWVLGFKTEGPAPFIETRDDGVTELLGAYNYINATVLPVVPPDAVPYPITDARASLTFLADNFRDNDYSVYIEVKKEGSLLEVTPGELPRRFDSPNLHSHLTPCFRALESEMPKD